MKEISHKIISKIRFIYSYIKSLVYGFLWRKKFEKSQSFVIFLGYPRSGHSLIAALLDAHPNIVMGMEWGLLPHLKMGYSQNQVYASIIQNSRRFQKRKNNVWTGYSYKVENSWQGSFDELHVIGDKFGGRTSIMLYENPDLLQLIETRLKLPVKYIHVIRNPFDVITTMTRRSFEKLNKTGEPGNLELLPFIKNYFNRVETVSRLKDNSNLDIYDLYHEDFILQPGSQLKSLLNFLGVNYTDEYINDCEKIVYKEPHKSRQNIEWTKDLIQFVESRIKKFGFLQRYSWNH